MTFPSILRLSRARLALLGSASIATLAFACGGISDPTRGGAENVATVSGSLTGTSLPANARVALVWRKPGVGGGASTVEVGSDVPVVGGKFTMNVGAPSAAYLQTIEGSSFGSSSSDPIPPTVTNTGGSSGTSTPPSAGTSSSGGAKSAINTNLTPRDIVGGSITEPLSAAVSGFVVYADTNGNGKLDLTGEYASSTDQILGGNSELILAYLEGGGALDYEKLRDKASILPTAGFNLAWSQGRWLPLNVVELKLTGASSQLPSAVCSSYASSGYSSSGSGGTFVGSGPSSGGSAGNTATPPPTPVPSGGTSGGSSGSSGSSTSGSPGTGYPDPSDPNLHCAPDGRSYYYTSGSSCPPPAPTPTGLCAGSGGYDTAPCATAGYSSSIPSGDPIPSGWPCISVASDGGAADGGSSGSSSGGPFDAGGGG